MDEKRKTKGDLYPKKERVWEKCWVVYVDLSSYYPEVCVPPDPRCL